MTQKVTATEAARNLSDLLNRVSYQGESFDIVRGGKVVARLTSPAASEAGSVAQLVDALKEHAGGDEVFAADLERIQAEQPKLPEDPWGI